MTGPKRILLIAGPNGAGKTTFATEYLPNEAGCPNFVNADRIAAGLHPFRPATVAFQAGRLVIETMRKHARRGESFAFETTLSGRHLLRAIPRWRQRGYRVKLLFLRLPNPEMACTRVRLRVSQGGHDVPEAIVYRRFHTGRRNFERIYRDMVDQWILYDSSGIVPVFMAAGRNR